MARRLQREIRSFAEVEQDLPELHRVLRLPRPIYFEDDPGSLGLCSVCGKRGTFFRCTSCGLLAHLSCLGSTFECPRCSQKPLPDFVPWHHGGLRRTRFEKGTICPPTVGLERGYDSRPACSLLERPTDAEAVAAGFKDAKEWYIYSAGGACIGADTARPNFDSLPSTKTPSFVW